jgi:hypothetical protein
MKNTAENTAHGNPLSVDRYYSSNPESIKRSCTSPENPWSARFGKMKPFQS